MMGKMGKKHSVLFRCAMAFSVISSLSLLAAIMVNSEGKNREILIIFGLLFWLSLALEQIFFWQANRLMKKAITSDRRRVYREAGIISFGSTSEGLVADGVFFVSLIALLICLAFGLGEALMQYIFICLMVLSFRLHCFLNGRNYRYKKILERKVDCKNG